jgi:hypothetical protein
VTKVACATVLVLAIDLVVLVARLGDGAASPVAATGVAAAVPFATTTTTAPPPPPPTTVPPTTTTTEPPRPAWYDPARPFAWTVQPYQGLGVWIDVYDWTMEITGGNPRVGPDTIDQMADQGIQTIYLQTSHRRSASDVMEPDRLLPMIDRAHARGMHVVAWYLPMLEDVHLDLRRLVAAADLPVDGVGVDIESLAVGDVAERNRRLLELSTALRNAVGDKAISAITPDLVVQQVINPGFWPAFPWVEIGATYDVVVPMAYWSVRAQPEWRSGARYVAENIDRARAATGRPDLPVHVAGGIADGVTLEDLTGMVDAIATRGALGGSLYDWATSNPTQWELLRALRVG